MFVFPMDLDSGLVRVHLSNGYARVLWMPTTTLNGTPRINTIPEPTSSGDQLTRPMERQIQAEF